MLLSFRFSNHRSFRDEQQLNLLPVYESEHADDDAELEAVSVAGIFGANASGKSNVISAFRYFCEMAGMSDRESEPGRGPVRQPFRLDPEVSHQPSSYVADLTIDGVRHTYGFSLDDTKVLEEWLYTYPSKRKRIVFERAGQKFDWGEKSSKSDIRKVADITSHSALFLSVAARFEARLAPESSRIRKSGRDETSTALHATYFALWRQVSFIGTYRGPSLFRYSRLLGAPGHRSAIVDLLRAADVGLQDIYVRGPEDPEDNSGNSEESASDERKVIRAIGDVRTRMQFLHRGAVGDVTLGVEDESSGTLRLLELAARALDVLERGGAFVVDEIDSSLHPLLTASLIRIFQSPTTNSRGAQLIFTTHDATLLGSIDGEDVLKRDQVWFTSKDDDGASELFPLAEFKPRREGENRQKRYLNGNYGAIPELSMHLFAQVVTARADSSGQ